MLQSLEGSAVTCALRFVSTPLLHVSHLPPLKAAKSQRSTEVENTCKKPTHVTFEDRLAGVHADDVVHLVPRECDGEAEGEDEREHVDERAEDGAVRRGQLDAQGLGQQEPHPVGQAPRLVFLQKDWGGGGSCGVCVCVCVSVCLSVCFCLCVCVYT